jgi:hypothetical protein
MSLARLAARAEEDEGHDWLTAECPWYRHVGEGGSEDVGHHCQPARQDHDGPPRLVVKLTPRTPEASTVHEPTVPPGGPGLFHVKGLQLPAYVQHLYKHLVGRYGREKAYGVAVGVVKKWAAGVHPGGKKGKGGKEGRVHADVQAAAQRNVAEWESDRAKAHEQSREHEHAAASAVGLAVQNMGTATAPGARPFAIAPRTGGSYAQYGLYQKPAATVSPSPPLPPKVELPTAAEVRALVTQVPEGDDVTLTRTVRKFLEQAAGKLERDTPIEALAALRGAQAALYAAHKKDLGSLLPSAYTANMFAAVPPAAQSSATTAMKQGRDRTDAYRALQVQVGACIDRIRKRFFHGVFSGPSQMGRLTTEDAMSALDRLELAGASITTGKDVSFPVENDLSQAKLLQDPGTAGYTFSGRAQEDVASLSPVDQLKLKTHLANAAQWLGKGDRMKASKSLLSAKFIAATAGAHHLESQLSDWLRAVALGTNHTNDPETARTMSAGGKTVRPDVNRHIPMNPGTGPVGAAKLTARLRGGEA